MGNRIRGSARFVGRHLCTLLSSGVFLVSLITLACVTWFPEARLPADLAVPNTVSDTLTPSTAFVFYLGWYTVFILEVAYLFFISQRIGRSWPDCIGLGSGFLAVCSGALCLYMFDKPIAHVLFASSMVLYHTLETLVFSLNSKDLWVKVMALFPPCLAWHLSDVYVTAEHFYFWSAVTGFSYIFWSMAFGLHVDAIHCAQEDCSEAEKRLESDSEQPALTPLAA